MILFLPRHRDGSVSVNKPRWAVDPSQPPSLWSVPPSQRYFSLHSNHHLREQHGRPPGPRGPASSSVTVQATWRGVTSSRDWTYLSVDRLLRDIEASRKNNPNHSWRDFATLSSDYHAPGAAKSAKR
ncbi:hypothetical protein ElyMa_000159600 [Elysia marginata]|uniref:Uncharacterized protein n=1 Tax=Elysia marginata TaxID=1093978 RepID=A0AAV4ET66_9GAST|nr:hypothetical protein ElyMa_000159600 [Elysia marginata]